MPENDLLIHIGQKIRQIRQQKHISQEELADLAGLDRTYIGGIERGLRNVSVLNLEKICNALRSDIVEIFKDLPSKK